MKNDCLFCAIIDGEIPSSKVYEDVLRLLRHRPPGAHPFSGSTQGAYLLRQRHYGGQQRRGGSLL